MRSLRYNVLVLAMVLIAFDAVPAQEDASKEPAVSLERIVVTNRRATSALDEATENIAVLGASQIAELPARDVSEVLRYMPGVDVQPRQGFGREVPITIQGADSRQVKVMIDGIPLNTQSSGQVNPVEFPIENIARIEVIKGAASSMWGSALGGVINIVTKDTGSTLIPKGSVTNSFAGYRTRKNSFDVSGKAAGVGYYVLSDFMESGGRGARDDVSEKKAYGKLSYDLQDLGRFIASFGYSSAEVNSGRFPDGTWLTQPYRDRYGKIGWENEIGASDIRVDLKHFRKDILTRYFAALADDVPYFEVQNHDYLYQLSVNSSSHLRKKDLLVLGIDLDHDALKSPSYLTKAKSVRTLAPYANYSLAMEPWDLNLGLRYDYNSEYGDQFSPSLGSAYHFRSLPDTVWRLGASRAFNAPPLLWKFSTNPALRTAPNPDLKPERAWVYETGLESQALSFLWLKLSLYRADVSDAIDTARNASRQIFQKNYKKYRRQGVEFQQKVDLCARLALTTRQAFNDIEDRSTRKIVRGHQKPRQSFDAGLEYKNRSGTTVSLIGYYNRWNEASFAYLNALGEEVVVDANDRKMLCDLRITQDYKNFTFFFNVHNLGGSKYWASFDLPAPQRYLEGGFSFKW